MEELQAKLLKRKQSTEKQPPPPEKPPKETGQFANLANILEQTKKTEPKSSSAPSHGGQTTSRREMTDVDEAMLGLEKEFDWINTQKQ